MIDTLQDLSRFYEKIKNNVKMKKAFKVRSELLSKAIISAYSNDKDFLSYLAKFIRETLSAADEEAISTIRDLHAELTYEMSKNPQLKIEREKGE
jgi:protoheme ferro-lyase